MSSRRIGSTPFLELLPDSIAGDPAIRAAADALDGLLVPSVKAIPSLLLYARLYGKEPDLLPPLRRLAELTGGLRELEEPLLDLLAWQLHVDNYEIARTYAEKLEMVKTAIAVHRKKGTPWAVETAVTAALGNIRATVTEWFEYGGAPYLFRVRLDVTDVGLDDERRSSVLELVETWKNTRSWLDAIETSASVGLGLRYGVADVARTHAHVYGYMAASKAPDSIFRTALALSGRNMSVLALSIPDALPAPPLSTGIAAVVRERTRGAVGIYQEDICPSAVSDVPVLACIARTRSRIAAE